MVVVGWEGGVGLVWFGLVWFGLVWFGLVGLGVCGGGCGGSDGAVHDTSLAIRHHRMHLIPGVMSLWT